MQPQTDADYKKVFSELIKKQMVVLGPDITMAKVKNVTGITVSPQGDVTEIHGDPQAILQTLINQFVELSGMIVKKTMESILTTYPGMAGIATGAMGVPSTASTTQTSASTPTPAPTPQVSPVQNQPQKEPLVAGANPFSDAVAQPVESENDSVSQGSASENATATDAMNSINKALADMGNQSMGGAGAHSLENKTDNVSQSTSN